MSPCNSWQWLRNRTFSFLKVLFFLKAIKYFFLIFKTLFNVNKLTWSSHCSFKNLWALSIGKLSCINFAEINTADLLHSSHSFHCLCWTTSRWEASSLILFDAFRRCVEEKLWLLPWNNCCAEMTPPSLGKVRFSCTLKILSPNLDLIFSLTQ